MKKVVTILSLLTVVLPVVNRVSAEETPITTTKASEQVAAETKSTAKAKEKKAPAAIQKVSSFEPFTGKVTKTKVRLRLQPRFDAPVVRELEKDEYLVIKDDSDEFYGTLPSKDVRGYVFRTYVLDNVIEGSHVNVRLRPDLDAPVVAQLNSGDRVNGTIDPKNQKWMEIALPDSVRFYVAKDYVQKVGDAGLLARLDKKRSDMNQILQTTQVLIAGEFEKPFDQIQTAQIETNYKKVINGATEFPDLVDTAKGRLAAFNTEYQKKKVAHLEEQTKIASEIAEKNKQLAQELETHKEKILTLEQNVQQRQIILADGTPKELPANISAWVPAEDALYTDWSNQNQASNNSLEAFYQDQKDKAFILKGIVDPYNRIVKNKPGDYMLLSPSSKLPIAFLYSTNVNLQNYVGHEVAVLVAPRPNNFYAFPAYFVLSIE